MSRENVELMRTMYEAFGEGDMQTVLGRMDEGIEWHESENFLYADRSPYIGPQAVLGGVFMRLGEDWEGLEGGQDQVSCSADRVVVLGSYNAKARAPGKASGMSSA